MAPAGSATNDPRGEWVNYQFPGSSLPLSGGSYMQHGEFLADEPSSAQAHPAQAPPVQPQVLLDTVPRDVQTRIIKGSPFYLQPEGIVAVLYTFYRHLFGALQSWQTAAMSPRKILHNPTLLKLTFLNSRFCLDICAFTHSAYIYIDSF